MTAAVTWLDGDIEQRVVFDAPYACLPVLTRQGERVLVPWGRRAQESGCLPVGTQAELEAIRAGAWDACFPIPVQLPLYQVLAPTISGQRQWMRLQNGECVQGLLARAGHTRRVYIVTVTDSAAADPTWRYPRIINSHLRFYYGG